MTKKTKKKTTKKAVNRKTVKKRTSNKKVVRKRKPKDKVIPARFYIHKNVPRYNLHAIKLQIMSEVPIMPCTVIGKDRHGRLFAHTQAEKVYAIYREKCQENRLTIRRERGSEYDAECPKLQRIDNDWQVVKQPCVRFSGQWEICHQRTGEHEYFEGAGDGDNDIWSICSAQTVAKKVALLDYFEVPWPQPTDMLEVVAQCMRELKTSPKEFIKAVQGVIPPEIFKATGIEAELVKHFNKVLKGSKKGKS